MLVCRLDPEVEWLRRLAVTTADTLLYKDDPTEQGSPWQGSCASQASPAGVPCEDWLGGAWVWSEASHLVS